MKRRDVVLAVLAALITAAAAAGQGAERPPKVLHAHPDRDSDGPYWVAASYAFRPDGTVRGKERIGEGLASALAEKLGWPEPERFQSVTEDTPWTELGCEISPEKEIWLRDLRRRRRQIVFPPGDFRGWTAASDAVVLGTATGFVPGFDQDGRPNTLVLLRDTEHLYPSRKYPYFVKYAILPYARFFAADRVFCAPEATHQEYYPEVGDRLLIAAGQPADRAGQALTVMGMSRVVQVKDDGGLLTHGRSDYHPVTFAPDFPETLEEARTRAWNVWRDGFVDLADTLGHEKFTKLWRSLKDGASAAVRPGCFVLGVLPDSNGWTSAGYRC